MQILTPVLRRGNRSSRPPVIPDGSQDQHQRHQCTEYHEPCSLRQVDRQPDADPVLGVAEQRVDAADRERADDRAPQARDAADDEHRQRQEGQLEVDLLGRDRAEHVDEQPAGEAASAPLSVNAHNRCRCTLIPTACAAAGSSRVARSFRPSGLRW